MIVRGNVAEKGSLLPAATGIAGGKLYMIRVNRVQRRRTTLETRPRGPIQKGPWRMLLRPLRRRQVTGMA